MIRPINSVSFCGVRDLGAQKVARKVVNVNNQMPKGISKVPVRLEKDFLDTSSNNGPFGIVEVCSDSATNIAEKVGEKSPFLGNVASGSFMVPIAGLFSTTMSWACQHNTYS